MQIVKDKNYISLVINLDVTSHDIERFLLACDNFLVDKFEDFEYIFVDNNAQKSELEKINKFFANKERHASIINTPYEVNKEQAILMGVDAAIGDFVFEFEDTELDYAMSDLWSMYQACLDGHDIVLLKPHYKQSFGARIFYKLLAKHSNKNMITYHSRINLVSRRLINRVNSLNKIIPYRKFAYSNSGLSYQYIEYQSSKAKGAKDFTFAKIDFATDLLLMFTSLGKKVALFFSLIFCLISVIVLIYTIVVYATINVVNGWTTLMLFLSISFMGLFLCLSIIIKYLGLLATNQFASNTFVGLKKKI